jgi:hypothetical protein
VKEVTLRRGILQRTQGLGTVYLATLATGSTTANSPFVALGFGNVSASGVSATWPTRKWCSRASDRSLMNAMIGLRSWPQDWDDPALGAELIGAFKVLIENPMMMVV